MTCQWQCAFAIVLASLTGCSTQSMLPTDEPAVREQIARQGLSESDNLTRVSALAKKIESAYTSCSTLKFTAKITEPPHPELKRVEIAMTPGRLKSRIFIDDVPVLVWTHADGQWQECKAAYRGIPAQYFFMPVQSPDEPIDVRLSDGIERHMCGFGGYYHTWLAKDSGRIRYFTMRVSNGFWIGTHRVDNHRCDVVACLPNQNYGGTELIYIRPDGFISRWDSIRRSRPDESPRLVRIRTYSDFQLHPLPPETWEFESIPKEAMEVVRVQE
ncbi:MAG: hypothetical protein KF841_00240 [Phycisphaerae bacterium]|nr:hypothetical protein [Phycisphaerae bacterium]